MNSILDGLNEQQKQAVVQIQRPLLVLAGAGSGKTRVITHKIAYLIEQGYNPQEILALTFTKKAANEMKERVINLLSTKYENMPAFIGTFHSFGARILRQYSNTIGLDPHFSIYDEQDQLNLVKSIVKSLNPKLQLTPGIIHNHIKKNKTAGLSPKEFWDQSSQDPIDELIYTVYNIYQRTLKAHNAVDFTDLLTKLLQLLKEHEHVRQTLSNRFKYVLVDEYQDTNPPQYKIIYLLTKDHRKICVVGDEDQSIYSWRGATIENIRKFQQDFPEHELIKLEQNYRSTQIILNAANTVISKNPNRIDKNLWSKDQRNIPIKLVTTNDQREQALFIVSQLKLFKDNLNDVAILYRMNSQSRVIEEQLLKYNIPYRLVGGVRFYERMEIKDILAYLHFLDNPRNQVSLLRIINTPTRGIGPKAISTLREISNTLQIPFSNFIYIASLWYASQQNQSSQNTTDLLLQYASKNLLEKLADYKQVINKYHKLFDTIGKLILAKHANNTDVSELIQKVITVTQYTDWLKKLSTNNEEYESRRENVSELLNLAKSKGYEGLNGLTNFLEDIALIEQSKEAELESTTMHGKVNLMTIHASKGLEFKTVFLIDAIDGIIPHQRSKESPIQLQEERRLFYVAITRTKEHLYIIYPQNIFYMGSKAPAIPSPYINDIPGHLIDYMVE